MLFTIYDESPLVQPIPFTTNSPQGQKNWDAIIYEQLWLEELGTALKPFLNLMESSLRPKFGDLDEVWNGLPKHQWYRLYMMATGVGFELAAIQPRRYDGSQEEGSSQG